MAKKTVGTLAKEMGVTGFFGDVQVANGHLDYESARELMLERIAGDDPELATRCECCVVMDLMAREPVVPKMRNGTPTKIREHVATDATACTLHRGRVSCCRAVGAYNEGLTGIRGRNGHPLTWCP